MENLTQQEAEAYLQHLAQIASGDSIQSVLVSAWNGQEAQSASGNAQGHMPESMYRTLLEQLPVVTFMAQLGKDYNEIYVSPQIEAMLGYSQEEWLADPVLWYERLHPEDQARWNVEFAHFLILDRPFRSVYRFIARDGRVVWVRGDIQIVRNEQGSPAYIQGVGYDITELKEAEEALKRAHDQLELRVEERTSQLAAANAALREEIAERLRAEKTLRRQAEELRCHQAEIEVLNERLKRAMQETHHRVKNNLQIISALIEMQVISNAETISREELERIGTHARTLAVIHDLLTQHANQASELDALSAREVLEYLTTLLQQTAGSRRLHVHIEETPLSPKQAASLTIIINELVANALKYSSGDIEISFSVENTQAILTVADHGPGFPLHFNPLVDSSIGLELVEQVSRADLHAEVRYENREQGGAQVMITLPLTTVSILTRG